MMTMMIGMMTMMMMVIMNYDGYVMKRCREGKVQEIYISGGSSSRCRNNNSSTIINYSIKAS